MEDSRPRLSSPVKDSDLRPSTQRRNQSKPHAPRNNRPITMGDDTFATRRHLPHLEKSGKTYFSTFATRFREVLTPSSRSIALGCCLHDHESAYWLECAVVMPDHVHLIFTPFEGKRLSTIMDAIKGASSHLINRATGRRGRLWGDESFDRIVRSSENLRAKCEYV